MRKTGKKFLAAKAEVEARPYGLADAMKLVRAVKFAKFDESVDVAMLLGVDPKHADQMVRGTVVLPHGVGKSKRVAVIAGGDKAKEAQESGADHVGPKGLMPNPKAGTVTMDVGKAVREIKAGKVEFRVDKTSIIHASIGKTSFD